VCEGHGVIGPQGIASECHFTLTRLNSLTPVVATNFLGSAAAAQNQINNSSAVTTLTGEYFFAENIERSLNSTKPRDCSEIYNSGKYSDGVYTVYLGWSQRPLEVYCDMTTDGGGWMVCSTLCCKGADL